MEPKCSLPHSQQPVICLYLEPGQSIPFPPLTHIFKIHLNIILPSMPGSSTWFCPSGFPTQTLHTSLLSPIRATCSAHLILLGMITRTIFGERYTSLSSSLCSFLYSPVTSSLFGPNILLSTQFLNTLSLHSSPSVSDQVSHPYKTTKKSATLRSFYLFGYIFEILITTEGVKKILTFRGTHITVADCPGDQSLHNGASLFST